MAKENLRTAGFGSEATAVGDLSRLTLIGGQVNRHDFPRLIIGGLRAGKQGFEP